MEGLFGGGLVDEVLFCCGDSLEEDLHWEPRQRVFVNLVEFDNDEANDCAALFRIVEAFRGAFFFSASVELKTKGTVGSKCSVFSGHCCLVGLRCRCIWTWA